MISTRREPPPLVQPAAEAAKERKPTRAQLPQLPVARPMQQPLPLWMQGPPTVARVVEFYLEDYLRDMGRAQGTYESYAGPLRWFASVLPPMPTKGHVKHVLQERIEKGKRGEPGGLMPQTANQYKKYLKAAYSHAARNGWAHEAVRDPTIFPNWKVPRRMPRALVNPAITFPRLLAEACQNDMERALLCVLALLGGRISEARGLRWDRDLSPGYQRLTFNRQRVTRRKEERELKSESSHASFDVPDVLRGYLVSTWREKQRVLAEGGTSQQVKDARSPYVFPYAYARLAQLMARCRQVSPESFPLKGEGRGALAFHAFRDTLGALLAAQNATMRDGMDAMRHGSERAHCVYRGNWGGNEGTNEALLGVQAVLAGRLPTSAPGGGLHLVSED